jgi:membrane protein
VQAWSTLPDSALGEGLSAEARRSLVGLLVHVWEMERPSQSWVEDAADLPVVDWLPEFVPAPSYVWARARHPESNVLFWWTLASPFAEREETFDPVPYTSIAGVTLEETEDMIVLDCEDDAYDGIVETAFKVIFEVPVIPTQSFLRSIRAYAATQLRGLLVTLVAVLLLIVSLLIRIVVPIAFAWANSGLLVVMSSVLSFSLLFTSLALIFRVLPPRRLLRSEIVEGALISSSILEVSFVLLRVVTLHVDFGAAYGAAGALIGTLIVLYFAAQLFVFGAEITAELEQRRTALALAVSRLRT